VLGSLIPPERVSGLAKQAELGGFDEVWLSEDYFYTAALGAAGAVLSGTEHISVGTGIVSAMVRHPAVLAMEASTLARMFPGRFKLGLALGLSSWLKQMGVHPHRRLRAVRECILVVQDLLDGKSVSHDSSSFYLHQVQLAHPPHGDPPIYMGGIAPKMLQLSGAVADGTILALLSGPAYLRWARKHIEAGRKTSRRSSTHRIVVFAFFSCEPQAETAKENTREVLAWYAYCNLETPHIFGPGGIAEDLAEMGIEGADGIARLAPDEFWDEVAVVGDPEECARKIRALFEAGADAVALYPMPADRAEAMIAFAAQEVLPRVHARDN
jgi:5,10-methylenetetrahydromethanopterin reductase